MCAVVNILMCCEHVTVDDVQCPQVYTGVSKLGYIQPQTLARQDIVITSYKTLRKEIDYVDLPHTNSQLLQICMCFYGFISSSFLHHLQEVIVMITFYHENLTRPSSSMVGIRLFLFKTRPPIKLMPEAICFPCFHPCVNASVRVFETVCFCDISNIY